MPAKVGASTVGSGQVAPSATTETVLYTVPAQRYFVSGMLTVCNRNAGAGTFRVRVIPSGATPGNEHYLYYDTSLAGSSTLLLDFAGGMALNAGDVVKVYASTADFSFGLFGFLSGLSNL